MPWVTVYRKDCELFGKELSANTLASFLVAQGCRSLSDLSTVWVMNEELLLFLNNEKAIDYWLKDGRLLPRGGGLVLSKKGLSETIEREANEALAKDGKRKAVNVSPALVADARIFILSGKPCTAGVAVSSRRFELDVPDGNWKA